MSVVGGICWASSFFIGAALIVRGSSGHVRQSYLLQRISNLELTHCICFEVLQTYEDIQFGRTKPGIASILQLPIAQNDILKGGQPDELKRGKLLF
jgi:hypothetical protein